MNRDEAETRMREVQRIMERATLFTLLPGVPAVVGGALVLVGCAVSYAMLRSLDFGALVGASIEMQWAFCLMWTAIGALAVAVEVVLAARAARQQGLSPTARPLRFAVFSLSPAIFTAVILTFRLLMDSTSGQDRPLLVQYVVPVWMMCYGTGVYTAGLFSIRLPRVLGLAFIVLGALALLYFPGYGVVSAALSFGLLHILFGGYVIGKAKRGERP